MAHKVEWLTTKTSRLVKIEKYQGPDGKNKYKRHTQKVEFTYPQIVVDSAEDVAPAVHEIISLANAGFTNVKQVVDHMNYGMKRSIASAYNRGLDPKLSPSQLKGVQTYVELVSIGWCDRETAVLALRSQQIDDAEAVFDMAYERHLNPDLTSDDDE